MNARRNVYLRKLEIERDTLRRLRDAMQVQGKAAAPVQPSFLSGQASPLP